MRHEWEVEFTEVKIVGEIFEIVRDTRYHKK